MSARMLVSLGAAGALAVACSVVNSFDEVPPGLGAGGAGQGGSGGGDSGGTSGSGGTGALGGGGSAGDVGTGGMGGDSTGGAAGAAPAKGIVVLGGRDESGPALTVLDALTGERLGSDPMVGGAQIAGVAYDGAPGRDLWFVFTAADFPPAPDKAADLQVRRYDDRLGAWRPVASFTTLPPPVPGTLVVLNERLAYLSHRVQGTAVTPWITILDTTNPAAITQVTYEPAATPNVERIGLLGTRGTANDPRATGGTLNVISRANCDSTNLVCQMVILPVAVGTTVSDFIPHVLGDYRGKPAFAAAITRRQNLFALPPLVAGQTVRVFRAPPEAPEDAQSTPFPSEAAQIGDLTFAECQNAVMFSTVTDQTLNGVSSQNVGTFVDLARPGQLVQYEPFSRSVIAPYNPNAGTGSGGAGGAANMPSIDAYDVTTNQLGTSIEIVKRDWAAPSDVFATSLAVRFILPYSCE